MLDFIKKSVEGIIIIYTSPVDFRLKYKVKVQPLMYSNTIFQ